MCQGVVMPIFQLIILFYFVFSVKVYANESETCLEAAVSQRGMNQCAVSDYNITESELYQVISQIKKTYKSEEVFLVNLERSQKNWETQLELDLDLRFPRANEPRYYGSVFPVCYSGYRKKLTLQRIAFLKEWLKGSVEGDVCSGSVMNSEYLEKQNVIN